MNEFITSACFTLTNVVAVVAAVLVVTRRNPIYAALYLVVVFGCMAFDFWFLGAEFLGFMQLLVYAGAIMVLYLFVIMLINPREDKLPDEGSITDRGVAAGVSLLVFTLLFSAIQQADFFSIKRRLPGARVHQQTYNEARQAINAMTSAELLNKYQQLTDDAATQALSESDRLLRFRAEADSIEFEKFRNEVSDLSIQFSELAKARELSRDADQNPIQPPAGSPEAIWQDHGTVSAFGKKLFTDHLIVFELTSVLILVAIVGAVHLSLRPRRRQRRPAESDGDQTPAPELQEAPGV